MKMNSIEKYFDAAKRHGVASEQGDYKAANKAHKIIVSEVGKFRRSPDRGEGVLKELLKDPDPHVVCWAATHLLPLCEVSALSALKGISVGKSGIAGLNAATVIQEWEAGRLKVD